MLENKPVEDSLTSNSKNWERQSDVRNSDSNWSLTLELMGLVVEVPKSFIYESVGLGHLPRETPQFSVAIFNMGKSTRTLRIH